MGFELDIFKDEQLSADYVDWLVDERSSEIQSHFSKMWEYYTNPMYAGSGAASGDAVNAERELLEHDCNGV